MAVTIDASIVFADSIVPVMTYQFCSEYAPPFLYLRRVPNTPEPLLHLSHFRDELRTVCLPPDLEFAFAALRTKVGESEKVERPRFPAFLLRVFFRKPAELDYSGFVFRQFQSKLREPLLEHSLYRFRFVLVLNAYDEIIGVANHLDVSSAPFLDDFRYPEIEHVVQVDIRKHG